MNPEDLKLAGVIGGGVMGGGIAQVLATHGFNVVVKDINEDVLAHTRETVINGRYGLKRGLERGKLSKEQMDAAIGLMRFSTRDEDLVEADLIIEAIPEDLELKKKTFSELDKKVNPEALFASNTSGFSIVSLAGAVERKDRFMGMHWFSPVPVMKLIEIIWTPDATEESILFLEELGRKLGKITIRVKDAEDKYGFVANRIYYAMVAESQRVLEEGIASMEDINNAMKYGYNWPAGPFELMLATKKGWQ